MKAWHFDPQTKSLEFVDVAEPTPRHGAVTVRVEAAMVLSYMSEVLEGTRGQTYPDRAFVPGTDAIGTVCAVGHGVYHLQPGQRVSLQPHVIVREVYNSPAEILMGHLARVGPEAERLQDDWVNGAFAEVVEWPVAQVTPIDQLTDIPASQALALSKLVVPYGGLLRVGLQAGEVVAVNGASGFYGSAGVLVALAMGASRVLALGRNQHALDAVCENDTRAIPVALTGDPVSDVATIRDLAGGGVDVGLDLVGADRATATETTLRSLKRGGRLAMMGSCAEPLAINFGEILINNWLIAGQFMYPHDAVARLVNLVSSGMLDLAQTQTQSFALADLKSAMAHATTMKGLDLTAVVT